MIQRKDSLIWHFNYSGKCRLMSPIGKFKDHNFYNFKHFNPII